MKIRAPPWIELPGDVTANILGRLSVEEILGSAQRVCSTWRKVCKDYPEMWRVITMRKRRRFRYPRELDFGAALLCREAVDRSQGQLIELSLDDVDDFQLLNYVADRSSKLRSLKLVNYQSIMVECLTEAVEKLPHLEELHLSRMVLLLPADIGIIGISCPLLKSFTWKESWRSMYVAHDIAINEFGHNKYALAIAKTMSNLRHLQLAGLLMKNEDLEAILDGCPLLESLYLWDCFHLDLEGAIGKRCSEQIKDLRVSVGDICCWFDSDSSDIEL